MNKVVAALFVTANLVACASTQDVTSYPEVTIEELVAHPERYKRQRVRVSGFLVSIDGDLQVLDNAWTECYGSGENGRRFVTTDLPRSIMGELFAHPAPFGPKFTYHGRFVVVTGIFEGSDLPWGEMLIEDDLLPAAGPLKKARVVEMTAETCTFTAPGSHRSGPRGDRLRMRYAASPSP